MSANGLYPGFRNPLLGAPRTDLPKHVAIIGAGTIGPDIGYYFKAAVPGMRLTLIDIREEALAGVLPRYQSYIEKGIKRGKMTEDKAAKVLEGIVTTSDYDALADADLVIEAATEDIPLKKKIFAMVEERVAPEAVVCSNTSSIPASWLFDEMKHKGRTAITHFFAPAWRNPAVEVIAWADGDRAVVDYLRWMFAATGKVPLVTDDAIAFMLDRIFDNWTCEAANLLLRGDVTAKQVDSVAEEFVHAGPFFVLNMANGNPISYECNTRQMVESPAYKPTELLLAVDRWEVNKKPGTPVEVPDEVRAAVRDRLLGILCSQCLDIVARGIGTPEDLHLGSLLALGFKESPLDFMAKAGRDEVTRVLRRLEEERPGLPATELLDTYAEATGFDRFVLVDRLDDVVVLTIRRPAQLNALSDDVNNEILAVLKKYEADPSVTGFVIVGYGNRAFCAGAEIGRFTEMLGDGPAAVEYSRVSGGLLLYLDTITKPVVAAVNGLALGGGMELATRCHDIVAHPKAYFQLPEVTLGILPGIGGIALPYRKWPAAAATFTRMITQAERLTAAQAVEIGMVSALEADYDALVRLAAERARALAGSVPLPLADVSSVREDDIVAGEAVSTDGMVLSREVIDIIVAAVKDGLKAPDLPAALEVGYQAFGKVAETKAAAEGIGAFLGGRKPDFSGM